MKATELLSIGKCLLSKMSEMNLKRDDWKYVEVYSQFKEMRSKRVQHKAAIKILAEENGVSERTLERIFKRLSGEC